MTDKNYVTITPHAIIGYVNEDTPCGRAKAKQVKADLETLATMLQDTNLSLATKKAIYTDYAKSIREYVEREETCCGCTNECDCEEEEYEEPTIEDMESYSIYFGENEEIDCDSYSETVEKVGLLFELGYAISVFGYDSQGKSYELDIIEGSAGLYLRLA